MIRSDCALKQVTSCFSENSLGLTNKKRRMQRRICYLRLFLKQTASQKRRWNFFYHVIVLPASTQWAPSAGLRCWKIPNLYKLREILSSFLFGRKVIHSSICEPIQSFHQTLSIKHLSCRDEWIVDLPWGSHTYRAHRHASLSTPSHAGLMKHRFANAEPDLCLVWGRFSWGDFPRSEDWADSWRMKKKFKLWWNKWKGKKISGSSKSTRKDTKVGKGWAHGARRQAKLFPEAVGCGRMSLTECCLELWKKGKKETQSCVSFTDPRFHPVPRRVFISV